MGLYELSGMREGIELHPWIQPDVVPLTMAVLALMGLWLLVAGFPREAKRLGWSWSKPRNLTTRNASETPRTLGVLLSHAVAFFGFLSAAAVVGHSGMAAPTWWLLAVWMISVTLLRWMGAFFMLGPSDISSTLVEMSRHNLTMVGLGLAAWSLVASLHPSLVGSEAAAWGSVALFCLATLLGTLRSTSLIQGQNQHQVVGIFYLCTLEWGWSLFWILWSIRTALRGH